MSDTSQGPGWWVASDGKWYPPQQATGTQEPAAPEPAGDPSTPWWKAPVPLWLVVVIAVLALGTGGVMGAGDDEETASATTTTLTEGEEASTTSTTLRSTTTAQPATTEATTTTTTAPTTTTTTAPPRPGFGGGTQVVGTDVSPGLYVATGVERCYWERLSGLSGDFDDIVANDNASRQAIVEISASDVAFNSSGCGRWELHEAPAAPADTFGEGDWVVGEQIQPGRYRADDISRCYWERASGFGHTFDDLIANDNVREGAAIVEISPNDRRFTSSGCGTWRRQ